MWPKSDKDHTGQEEASRSLDAWEPLRKGATRIKGAAMCTGALEKFFLRERNVTERVQA